MSQAFAGVHGNVLSGTLDMDVNAFSFDLEVNEIDTTTTADQTWEDAIGELKKLTGTFDFFMTVPKNPFGTAAGLFPGLYATLTLYTGGTDPSSSMPKSATGLALITKVSIKSAVKEAITGTCSFRNKGPWTLPS